MSEYLPILQEAIRNNIWIILPLIGALIGWFTNFLAVKMLFRPRRAIKIFGLTFQGVFPKRQAKLAHKIGSLVSDQLLSKDDLQKNINTAITKMDLRKVIVQEIDNIILDKLPEMMPASSFLLSNKASSLIKNLIAQELQGSLEKSFANVATEVTEHVDLKQAVEEKISNFSPKHLEELVISVMKREFQFIELFGAIIGLLIGCFQLLLISI